MDIGNLIRAGRKASGMTQSELAQKAGVAVNSIRLYEVGKRQPGVEQIKRIANALAISPADFFDSPQGYNQRPDTLQGCIIDLYRQLRGTEDEGTSYVEEDETNWLMQILFIVEKCDNGTIDFEHALSQTKSVIRQCFSSKDNEEGYNFELLEKCNESIDLAKTNWCGQIVDAIYRCCDGNINFEQVVSEVSLATVQGQAPFILRQSSKETAPTNNAGMDEIASEILEKCKELNDLGIQRALEYMDLLSESPKFQREHEPEDKDVFSGIKSPF